MFKLFKKNETSDDLNIPRHIAVIMDGNGRWAKRRGLPRSAGHKEGSKTIREVALAANDLGIEVMTVYAFSTENWKRSKDEVSFLMKLPGEFFDSFLPELIKHRVKVTFIGRTHELPEEVRDLIKRTEERTKDHEGMELCIAFNYGSHDEMLTAMKLMYEDIDSAEEITKEKFESYLMTAGRPEIDMLIRTSGEQRLSNFLLWQLAYCEFYFTDKAWPDFDREALIDAIYAYNKRERRFGGVK